MNIFNLKMKSGANFKEICLKSKKAIDFYRNKKLMCSFEDFYNSFTFKKYIWNLGKKRGGGRKQNITICYDIIYDNNTLVS